jgi:hypothetical protein
MVRHREWSSWHRHAWACSTVRPSTNQQHVRFKQRSRMADAPAVISREVNAGDESRVSF